jgi:beta-galactosidase GanA
MRMLRASLMLCLLSAPTVVIAQQAPVPKIVTAQGRHTLLVDGEPFVVMGAQAHNSSAWPALLPKVWPAMDVLQVNTVELPVYWEQMEPASNRFDFGVVDTLLAEARQHKKRLVLLWFGTWKNGSAHYRPAWIKQQPARFPNMVDRQGKPVDSPSPHSKEALDADIRAFSALMRHLKEVDPQRTVIMVQVQNEPGTWGSVRDFSPAADRAFRLPVPAAAVRAMGRPVGSARDWQATFGNDADEYFHTWSIAQYIERVAAAGKAIYPLPLYVNAALKDPFQTGPQPPYEFGGPTFNVIALWKAAAPSIDVLAPDIYQSDTRRYLAVLDQYARPDNPLFVPETIKTGDYVRFFYAALARGAIGFAPFGIDYTAYAANRTGEPERREADLEQLALSYRAIGPMMREVARWASEGKLQAAIEDESKAPVRLDLGTWTADVRFGVAPRGEGTGNAKPIGRLLVARLSPDEFIVTGNYANIRFKPAGGNAARAWEFLSVEEGQYANGVFRPVRIWNGDETDWGLSFSSAAQVLRVKLSVR